MSESSDRDIVEVLIHRSIIRDEQTASASFQVSHHIGVESKCCSMSKSSDRGRQEVPFHREKSYRDRQKVPLNMQFIIKGQSGSAAPQVSHQTGVDRVLLLE